MTILSNSQIVAQLGKSVIIEPFDIRNVNTSSYDVTLGEWYFIEHRPNWWRRNSVYNIWDAAEVRRVWGNPARAQLIPQRYVGKFPGINGLDRVILIPPKHTILAHTNEFIGGRYDTTTMMKARSSFGRNFIEVCKCAGYGDVGYFNRWTMEITNNSRFYHIPLVVGRRIAQIVFMETGQSETDYSQTGKYQKSASVTDLVAQWKPELMLPRLDRDRETGIFCPHGADWDDCPVCCH